MKKGSITLGITDECPNGRFSVNDYGYLTAEYGKIGGFKITAYSIYNDMVNLHSRGITFTMIVDEIATTLGHFNTNQYAYDTNAKGINMLIEYSAHTRYLTWGYRSNASADGFDAKFSYFTKNPGGGANYPDDSLVLGTNLYLNGWAITNRWNDTGVLYKSYTCLNDSLKAPRYVELVLNLRYNGNNSYTWESFPCYIVNGLISST